MKPIYLSLPVFVFWVCLLALLIVSLAARVFGVYSLWWWVCVILLFLFARYGLGYLVRVDDRE
ncbi:hypothetical protein EKE94_05125 [Mesobaculum littorinae]|uniref:Uncharacterized protein n=1 Tax=Mesobaculum littorinae TaxID=2486419 RepID=A0A438AHW1_9RHOB|nr:hypothetical protein EKE94_05125 [Mesobaculum littorinae]